MLVWVGEYGRWLKLLSYYDATVSYLKKEVEHDNVMRNINAFNYLLIIVFNYCIISFLLQLEF